MSQKVPIALVLTATVGLGACSGDDDEQRRADRPFCVVQEEIDDLLSAAFEEAGPDATEEEQNAALVAAAEDLRDDGIIEEFADAAPPEIATEAQAVAAALEAVADGDASAIIGGEVDAARVIVEDHCFAVGAPGDEDASPAPIS